VPLADDPQHLAERVAVDVAVSEQLVRPQPLADQPQAQHQSDGHERRHDQLGGGHPAGVAMVA
jgi:hypothetical protein